MTLIYNSELKKLEKKISKVEEQLKTLNTEKDKCLRHTVFKCDAVIDKGTLFKRVCEYENEIGELTYIQPLYYNSAAYEEGWDTDYHCCMIKCPSCGNIHTYRTSYDFNTGKYKHTNEYVALKDYFKEIKKEKIK
jgi:hypothetical protein